MDSPNGTDGLIGYLWNAALTLFGILASFMLRRLYMDVDRKANQDTVDAQFAATNATLATMQSQQTDHHGANTKRLDTINDRVDDIFKMLGGK